MTAPSYTLHQGDCLHTLRTMADNSVDSIVTDPPYGLSFMGKKWDYDVPSQDVWAECLRVLKPGGHLLAFAGTRTQHRMAVRIEDAGFEIRDMIAWVYSQGFPKSADVSKQIDQQEKHRWFKISNAIDNASLSELTELWINSKNANAAGLSFQKKETEAGLNTPKSGFAHGNVLLQANLENCDALAVIAELSLIEAHRTSVEICSSVQSSAESGITESKSHAITAGNSPENREATLCMVDFSALPSAWGWQDESKADKLKAVEALKTWLGSKQSSKREATSALCAALTDDLKLITLSQSKTFLSFDTTRQMDCVSAISATTTESTAASLISFTANTLRSKAIDKAAGAEREVVGSKVSRQPTGNAYAQDEWTKLHGVSQEIDITAPATEAARQWQGWGTALKPALEPITVARKPLVGTVAENVLKHGTGALNIDGCRVGDFQNTTPSGVDRRNAKLAEMGYRPGEYQMGEKMPGTPPGRWPANLFLDGSDEVVGCFPQTKSGGAPTDGDRNGNTFGEFAKRSLTNHGASEGSAARFFYCAKASKKDRDEGLEGFDDKQAAGLPMRSADGERGGEGLDGTKTDRLTVRKNSHPTVKPTDLMRYLVRLVTPPGGTVLDCFNGSGSTGKAAVLEGFNYIGCELDPAYIEISRARIEYALLLRASGADKLTPATERCPKTLEIFGVAA